MTYKYRSQDATILPNAIELCVLFVNALSIVYNPKNFKS